MEVVHVRCAGLDVHKKRILACVRTADKSGPVERQVKTFGTTTGDLMVLSDWLRSHGVTHVAMESTGIFWKPVYAILEGSFTLLVVNAAHMKAVPGRKTDVRDCEWIADLLAHGLLKGGFIPPVEIRDLRDLTRYRTSLVGERTREVNRLHKLLETANIKLTSVATDVMGVSAQAMLQALLEGTTDPDVLANLAKGTLRKKLPELKKALEGRFTAHHRLFLATILGHIDFLDETIAGLGKEITTYMAPFQKEAEMLDEVMGISVRVAETIISEIGVNMDAFPTDKHLASWAALCPGNNESAGKHKSGKTRKGNAYLKRVLTEAANACANSKTSYLGARYQRIAKRRGRKKAIVAIAHSILVISYHILKYKTPYYDLGLDYFDKLNKQHLVKYHQKRLQNLGFKVTIETLEEAA
jgi:transposase